MTKRSLPWLLLINPLGWIYRSTRKSLHGTLSVDHSKHKESKSNINISNLKDHIRLMFNIDLPLHQHFNFRTRMVTTVYYNGVKLKTQLEDTALGSNRIHGGGIFILGQESVSSFHAFNKLVGFICYLWYMWDMDLMRFYNIITGWGRWGLWEATISFWRN